MSKSKQLEENKQEKNIYPNSFDIHSSFPF